MPDAAPRLRQWALWFAALAAAAAVLLAVRGRVDKAHVALVLLLVVLGGSARGGRALGMALAATAFVVFDVLFLPPYHTFRVADPLDWLVLIAFLVTGLVAAQLFELQRRAAARESEERIRLARVEAEAESLRRADRMKDALLAAVSHDLRTPLTAIKGIANEVWNGGDPERAQTIEEEADRLNALVGDLLELSQLNAHQLGVRLALNTADDVVGAALERVEAVHGAGRVQVEIENAGAILVGRFDFAHTMRALTNLLENAIKYSPAGAPVRLRARREGAWLRFAVEDAGPGVPPDERERIFEPFVRGRAIPDGTRGTGLGLSIARQLAEAQGGTLAYEPREGGGSRFVLSLEAGEGPAD